MESLNVTGRLKALKMEGTSAGVKVSALKCSLNRMTSKNVHGYECTPGFRHLMAISKANINSHCSMNWKWRQGMTNLPRVPKLCLSFKFDNFMLAFVINAERLILPVCRLEWAMYLVTSDMMYMYNMSNTCKTVSDL